MFKFVDSKLPLLGPHNSSVQILADRTAQHLNLTDTSVSQPHTSSRKHLRTSMREESVLEGEESEGVKDGSFVSHCKHKDGNMLGECPTANTRMETCWVSVPL